MNIRDEKLGDLDYFPSFSRKEAIVMDLLLQNPSREMYGLEMVAASDGRLKRGTIYVTLRRMEDKGYVESKQELKPRYASGLPRRLYGVTGLGSKVYQAWQVAVEAHRSSLKLVEGVA